MLKNLFKSSVFSLLNNFFQLIVSLGSGVLIARNLGPIGKGEVFLITQSFNLVQIIFSFGFGPSIIYYLKQKRIRRSDINFFIFSYCFFVAAVFVISLCFFSKKVSELIGGDLGLRMLSYIFLIAHLNIIASFIGYKRMSEHDGVKYWSIITLISNVLYIVLLALFLLVYPIGVMGVVYAFTAAALLKIGLLLVKTGTKKEGISNMNLSDFKMLSTYGFQIFLSNFFLTSVFRIDTFLLNHMVKLSDLGIYSVAVNVAELVLLIPSAIGVALFPHLTGLERNQQQNTMCLIGRVSFVIGVIALVSLLVLGYPFILVVFGHKFIGAFIPFLFLLPGLMAMTLNYSYTNYISSIGQPLVGAYIFSMGLIINIILNLWLIPKIGIIGAAIDSSIAYIFITVCFVVRISKVENLRLKEFVFPKMSDFLYVKDKALAFLISK